MLETSLGPLCPRVAVESYAQPEAVSRDQIAAREPQRWHAAPTPPT
jgi:hypothetical protein